MHPVGTIKHWSHHLHDGMIFMWHEIDQHLRSRHFWAGIAVALLIVGFIALMVFLAQQTPVDPLWQQHLYGTPYVR